VAAGWAVPYLIESLDRGIHAVTPGGLHWVIAEVVRRYRAGDRPGAPTCRSTTSTGGSPTS
jgi:hypothetical protein